MRCAATKSAGIARERGAWVVFGGIHATLYPEEPHELGGAHAVVKGDGDVVWGEVVNDCAPARRSWSTKAARSTPTRSSRRGGT